MSAELITSAGHTITDQDFALLIEHLTPNASGVLYGCSISYGTSYVNIASGWCTVSGRLVKISEESISVTLPSSGNSTQYLCAVVDLSNADTPASLKIVSSIPATTTDFNGQNGTSYLLLATIKSSTSGITSATGVKQLAHLETRIANINTYKSATNLYGYQYFNGTVQHAIATVLYRANTPYSQVNNVVLEIGAHDVGGRIDINAYGTGFVNGHVLAICIFAMVY